MAIAVANLVLSTVTMLDVVTLCNNLAFLVSTNILTANNNANGSITTGNTYLAGIFAADTGAFTTIRGGNVQATATLLVASNVAFGNSLLSVGQSTTTNTNPNQLVDSFSSHSTGYRTTKYVVQIGSTVGYQATEVLLVHDGATVTATEYATLSTNGSLGTLSANISSNSVQLLFSPTNAVNTVKFERRSIAA
jgi:hypothetical protein